MERGSLQTSSMRQSNLLHTSARSSSSTRQQFHDSADHSSYQEYPASQPFIHDTYRRDPQQPVDASPDSNRQAVMAALKNIQDKIRGLEQGRAHAEKNLRLLTEETSRYRDLLEENSMNQRDQSKDTSSHLPNYSLNADSKELKNQLAEAEARSDLLEKHLDYMRRLVESTEREKSEAMNKAKQLERLHNEDQRNHTNAHLAKISELERDQMRLTALQTLSENKIRDLEKKVKEERHHRKLMQERSAELETEAQTQRILDESKKKVAKKKKKKTTCGKPPTTAKPAKKTYQFADQAHDHYHLKYSQIPFITGQSTSPSHSVPANVQKVLALMKSHNPKLCPTSTSHRGSTSSSSGVSSASDDLNDLLMQLQEEFGQMSMEHRELSHQLQGTSDKYLREDLERELDSLVSRMEVKGDQIAKVRKHQEMVTEKKLKKKKKKVTTTCHERPQSAMASFPAREKTEMLTPTKGRCTAKNKSMYNGGILYTHPDSPMQAKTFLHDLKKLQTTLRKDDLSWE